MHGDAELIVLPYSAKNGQHLLDRLIEELESNCWTEFRAAVAFGSRSGNFPDLLDALREFAEAGNLITITFSAHQFGGGGYATDFEAVEELVDVFDPISTASIHLYREPGRPFHPKIYLFGNEDRALIIVGSSNWGEGGLVNNVEANLALSLNLEEEDNRREYNTLVEYFERYWRV